jgi:hypothetical protein
VIFVADATIAMVLQMGFGDADGRRFAYSGTCSRVIEDAHDDGSMVLAAWCVFATHPTLHRNMVML